MPGWWNALGVNAGLVPTPYLGRRSIVWPELLGPRGQPDGGDIGRQSAPVMCRLRSDRLNWRVVRRNHHDSADRATESSCARAAVVEVWPALPEALKAGIVAMVKAAPGGSDQVSPSKATMTLRL